jgi:integrase
MAYTFGGKQKTLSFGPYPDVTLVEARSKRDAAKAVLRDRRDPMVDRQVAEAAAAKEAAAQVTFEEVAREWFAANSTKWTTVHADEVILSLKQRVFPKLGSKLISTIDKPLILSAVIRPMEADGLGEKTRRVAQRIRHIFAWAEGEGRVASNPAVGLSLKPKPPVINYPALTDLTDVRKMLTALDASKMFIVTRLATRFLALTYSRPGPMAEMEWHELSGLDDLQIAVWNIPSTKMKKGNAFTVPLCPQALDVIKAIEPLTGRSKYVFPHKWTAQKPMSENAMLYALNRIGYAGIHCPHGWRTSFSTIMNNLYPADRHIIDFALQHIPKGVEGVYNRAEYIDRRRELATLWADMLLAGMPSAADLVKRPQR